MTGEKEGILVIDDGRIPKMVRHHHERYDGAGYPDGLSGSTIVQLQIGIKKY